MEFSAPRELTVHLRTHTGEMPFMCAWCNAGFDCLRDLATHMWTHTGEDSLEFLMCDADFDLSRQSVDMRAPSIC